MAACGSKPERKVKLSWPHATEPTYWENSMSRMSNVAMPAILLVSALALSACATKPEPVAVAPSSQAPVVAEKPVVAEAQPAPAAIAEQPAPSSPAPKHKVKKAKKRVAKIQPVEPKAAPPAPVAAPAPVVEHEAPAIAPPPPVAIVQPAKSAAEEGFLEQYWLWLLGLGIVIAGIFAWRFMSQKNE